jgi:hypothetical protein
MRGRGIGSRVLGALALLVASFAAEDAFAAPPANDDFANATQLTATFGAVNGTNADATAEPGEPDHSGTPWGEALHSVWYRWRPAADGPASFDTCGSSFDTRIAIYVGTGVGSLSEVAANDDSTGPNCGGSKASETPSATFSSGTDYYIAVDTSGELNSACGPRGPFRLRLNGGASFTQLGCGNDDLNPSVQAGEQPYTFAMDRLKPNCREAKGDEDCPRKNKNLSFKTLRKVRGYVRDLRAQGADITLIENPKPSGITDGEIHEFLQKKGSGGEILTQNIPVGKQVTTTAGSPAILKVGYFEPAEDRKERDAALAAIEKAKKGHENKSKCDFIAENAPADKVEEEMAKLVGSGYLTQQRAGEILKKFGCGYEVKKYIDAPGSPTDFVKDVVGFDRKRDTIELIVALPVAQDLLMVVREDPNKVGRDSLGIGTDGALTASDKRFNVLTVQVVERLTGRLVSGAEVSFYGVDGKPVTETTDGNGEVTLNAKIARPDGYVLKAEAGPKAGPIVGFREIKVKDRGKKSFETMSGRTLAYDGKKADFTGTDADLAKARALPVVPANLGTGLAGPPQQTAKIAQTNVLAPKGNGYVVGKQNAVALPNDSNMVVGAGPGLITIGGGQATSVARAHARALAFGNPFAGVAQLMNGIVDGLKRVIAQGTNGLGTIASRLTAAQKASVVNTANTLSARGVPGSGAGLLSENGLGVISASSNIISDNGASAVSLGGLNLRDSAGNLIGQAGGNLIGQAGGNLIGQAGGNVVSLEGRLPVYGGNIISDNGAS